MLNCYTLFTFTLYFTRTHSALHLNIAGDLQSDRAGTSRPAMRGRLHDRFPGVSWTLGRPDLEPTLLFLAYSLCREVYNS